MKADNEKRTELITMKVQPSLKAAAQRKAKAEGRTLSNYIERLITLNLEEIVEDRKMLRTESYVRGIEGEVNVGETYYFGQLWDGNGDAAELLESGAIGMIDDEGEDVIVDFKVVEADENILDTIIEVTGI